MAVTKREAPAALLTLPGEIKNQIYRAVCVKETALLLRATLVEESTSRKRYRLSPGLPQLALVCRETHRDVASIYFEENTLLFSETAMTPKAVAAFERAYGSASKNIKRLKVSHKVWGLRNHFSARFIAEYSTTGIQILAGPELSNVLDGADGWKLVSGKERRLHEQEECCCNVINFAIRYQNVPLKIHERSPLLGFLQAYADDNHEREKVFSWAYMLGIDTGDSNQQIPGYSRFQCSRCNGRYFEITNKTRRVFSEELS